METTTDTNWYHDLSSQEKRFVQILAMILLTGLAASAFALAYSYITSARVAARTAFSPRQISVNGEGKVQMRPDIAVFTASVITQAKRVSDAQRQNSERSGAIIDFLKSQGIAEKDIKTVAYDINPQYQYFNASPCTAFPCPPQGPPEIVSYEVRHTMEIKIRKLDEADVALEGVTAAGANEIGGISFRVDDEDAARAEARAKAIADAEEKAEKIARELGVRLTRVSGFFESDGAMPYPIRTPAIGLQAMKADFTESLPSVQPGEQEIRAMVTVSYEFR